VDYSQEKKQGKKGNTEQQTVIPESQRLKHFYKTTVESHDDSEPSNRMMMTAYHNDAWKCPQQPFYMEDWTK